MYTDQPILKAEDDKFNRIGFAHMIGDVIISSKDTESICIGLMGPWGSGKTSIINMVDEYLQSQEVKPKIAIMKFSPWNFTTAEQLVGQFFFQLCELFGTTNEEKNIIGNAISAYAQSIENSVIASMLPVPAPIKGFILPLIKNGTQKLGQRIANKSIVNKSIQKQKDELSVLLKECKERILIIIDDIDRLTDDQIRSVFQLVSIVCKFPNISYLLSFERDIVSKALDKTQEGRGEEFLEKVIQVPISMPGINKKELFEILTYEMNQLLKEFNLDVHDESRWERLFEYCVCRLITTRRDIVRLYNGLHGKLMLMNNDIDIEDLIILTIIEQHEPRLYEWIKSHGDILTGQLAYEDIKEHGKDKKILADQYISMIKNLINSPKRYTIDLAIETLCMLFPAFSSRVGTYYSYNDRELRERNGIGHPMKFERYFSLAMKDDQISQTELSYLMFNADKNDIEEIIINKDNAGASIELFDEIRARIKGLEKGRTEILIYALQNIGAKLRTVFSNGLFFRDAKRETGQLINDLLLHLKTNERAEVLSQMIGKMDKDSLDLMSGIIHHIYVAYAKNEEMNTSDKIPVLESKEAFELINHSFFEKTNRLVDDITLSEVLEKTNFINYYKLFPDGKNYLTKIINSNSCTILAYVNLAFGHFQKIGSRDIEEIEINNDYEDLVTKADVKKAIWDLLNTGKFKDLAVELQRTAAAILLRQEEPMKYGPTISISDVDKRRKELLE